jgi:hypothetical protein
VSTKILDTKSINSPSSKRGKGTEDSINPRSQENN